MSTTTAPVDARQRPHPGLDRLARVGPLGLAVVIALGAALPHIDTRPVWLDEAYTVGATRDLVATWRGSGGTQALYYLLMWPVTRVSTAQAWLRLPSLACALGTVVVVHEIGRRVAGRRAGALAACTLAAMWALARYAIEARSYTLTILVVSLGWLGLVAAVQAAPDAPAERRRWWWLYVTATLLMPLAHGLAALQFAGHLAAFALAPDRRRWLRACVPVAAGLALEAGLLFTIGAGEVGNWVPPLHWDQVHSMAHVLFGYGLTGWAIGGVAVAGAVLAVVELRHRTERPGPHAPGGDGEPADRVDQIAAWAPLVPVLWLTVMPLCLLALSTQRPYAEPRYVLSSLPAVALLAGLALAHIRPRVLGAAAGVVLVVALLADHSHVTSGGQEDWPGVVAHLAAGASDGDRLLVPEKYRPPVDYWWTAGGDEAPRPDLVPLSPVEPLGDVRRFYDTISPRDMGRRMVADPSTTVWYVDRSPEGQRRVERLLADPVVRFVYVATEITVYDGDLYLVRFTPRG